MLVAGSAAAQEKCATVEIREGKRNKSLLLESDDEFESWITQKREAKNGRASSTEPYTIPIVVHVIHKGESPGAGSNISDQQILSQIAVLNEDFNRTNTDASATPTEFVGVASSLNVKFVLATMDPSGDATNGIVRVKGSKTVWATADESSLKATSYWPAEDYLNIWVTDLSATLLGYAQFPVSDLDGLESAVDNRLTDGVVIDYTVFGSIDDGAFTLATNFKKGRTATHEVGHFLGLRHIWGDDNGSCSGNGDYVADTPNQGNSTSGCPSHPQTSCSVHTMFQNYMDYTNDDCMNLFTAGQIERMITVLENSPRRVSLLSSSGTSDPSPVENDLAISRIASPSASECVGEIIPEIILTNKGSNTVVNVSIQTLFNELAGHYEINFPVPLAPGDSTRLSLDAVALQEGENTFTVEIVKANGVLDARALNNTLQMDIYSPFTAVLPYREEMNSIPSTWRQEGTSELRWQTVTTERNESTNKSLYLECFNSSSSPESLVLLSPIFDLSDRSNPHAMFDVSYAQSSTQDADGLLVYVLTDCNAVVANGTRVYGKVGSELATSEVTTSSFMPSSENDWRHEVIDLSSFAGQSIRLAFVGVNDGGNNIYLDDFAIADNVVENVTIGRLKSPSPVSCARDSQIILQIHNSSSVSINSIKLKYTVNDLEKVATFIDLDLKAGGDIDLVIDDIELVDGENQLSFILYAPNGLFDANEEDNEASYFVLVDDQSDIIPLKQEFEKGLSNWFAISPAGSDGWKLSSTNNGQSAYANVSEDNVHTQPWMVSPSLDFTNTTSASVFFDLAVEQNTTSDRNSDLLTKNDSFHVMISIDCGVSYSDTILVKSVSPTGSQNGQLVWTREYINLNKYAGLANVRIAFVVDVSEYNSVYLDNIEFFVSDNPTPLRPTIPYTLYGTDPSGPQDFYMTFNLDERQRVTYSLVDMTGRTILVNSLEDVLNQTVRVEPGVSGGVYILQVKIADQIFSSRVMLND